MLYNKLLIHSVDSAYFCLNFMPMLCKNQRYQSKQTSEIIACLSLFVCDLLQPYRETATSFLYRTTDLPLDLCRKTWQESSKRTLQLILVLRRQALPALCDMQRMPRMPRMPRIRMQRMPRMRYTQFPCEPFSTAFLQFLQMHVVHVVMSVQHYSKKEESRAIGMPYRSQTKSTSPSPLVPHDASRKWYQ